MDDCSNTTSLKYRCSLAEPYPEPRVAGLNPYYANLLLEDYSGAVSEMTAINQYLYHHFVFGYLKELSELERCIAIIEMTHLALLGKTILMLGLTPEYRTLTANIPLYWSATNVYYGADINDRLTSDIAAEIRAIENYRLHQRLIEDPYVRQLLERIIKDEELHLKIFQDALAKYHP